MKINSILIISFLAAFTCTHDLYEPLKSYVQKLSKQNWSQVLQKGIQETSIFIVHFYYSNDGKSYEFAKQFEESAKKFYGIVNFAHVNCEDNKQFCKKVGPKEFPSLTVYPPVPIPSTTFGLEMKKAINLAAKYVSDNTEVVNDENYQGFLGTQATLPKILYFNDKKKVSLIIKSLSTKFKNKIQFGVVQSDQKEVLDFFNVKKLPTLILQRSGDKKPKVYKDEIDYKKIFDFVNIYSQQFVPKESGADEDKPWLFQAIPEMHDKSSKEICFNQQKTLCLILFTPGEISAQDMEEMKNLKKSLDNRTSRLNFKFMWLNSEKHKEWVNQLEVDSSKSQLRVLKTGRRTKFYSLDQDFNAKNVSRLIEKIFGGDAHSKTIRSGIPAFTTEL